MMRWIIYSQLFVIPLAFYLVDFFPSQVWVGLSIIILFPFILIWKLVRGSTVRKQVSWLFWRFAISSLFLSCSSFFNFLLYEQFLFKVGLAFLIAFLQVLMLEHIYLYLYQTHRYETYSLGRIMTYTNLLSIFFFASAFYSLKVLLHLPVWIFILLLVLIVFILISQTLWISAIESKQRVLYVLIISLLIGELFGFVALLPVGFFTQACIVLVALYVLFRLTRYELFGNLDNRLMRRYAWSFIFLTLAVLLTSKWV